MSEMDAIEDFFENCVNEDGTLKDTGSPLLPEDGLDLDLDIGVSDNEYDVAIEVLLGISRPSSPVAMTSSIIVSGSPVRSPAPKRPLAVTAPTSSEPPAKKKSKKIKKKKGRKELPKTSKLKYGWEGHVFTGCVRVQAKGDLVHEKWTKDEVESKLDEMIGKWKWADEDASRHSNKNVPRWLHTVMKKHGSGWFRPQDVVIQKMDYSNRRSPREGTAKFYPPYDALCCGYEVRRCPFTEMDAERNRMRLSPVFVERLQTLKVLTE